MVLDGRHRLCVVNEDPATGPASVDLRADGRDETPQERSDRNLLELLNELRVALPGVQAPVRLPLDRAVHRAVRGSHRFQKDLYFVVLLLTTIATALLIAPTALHRLLFHMEMKAVIVQDSNRLAIAGLLALALAIIGAVMLITDVLFGVAACAIATGGTAILFGALWIALPLSRRARGRATASETLTALRAP